ncbi:MAG: ROK family protein, partial [Actinomycetota bacterium]|nr:ROK family protein [Actinomycetota bacterium]
MAAGSGATQEEVRRHNLSTLLTRIHRDGATSRAALTAHMGLNRSTIGALTTDLADAGLVREQPGGPASRSRSGGGRPSHVVVPQAERVFVLAVDIGVSRIVAARVGLGGTVLDRRDLTHERHQHGLADVVRVVAGACEDLLAAARRRGRCLGVGAGVPGAVSRGDGVVRFGPNLGWVDEPFGEALATRLALPVHVGNDADLGVLAEHTRGVAVGCDHVAYLSGEVGIGGGFLVDGRPLAGFGGYAGEIGHLVVHPEGRRCRCGARGCWETEVGEDALLELAGRPLGGGARAVREVFDAVAAGDPTACAAAH